MFFIFAVYSFLFLLSRRVLISYILLYCGYSGPNPSFSLHPLCCWWY